jgi:hypothetical protein
MATGVFATALLVFYRQPRDLDFLALGSGNNFKKNNLKKN